MKLLLCSQGITNESIAQALFDLTGKKPEDTIVAFCPTASNWVSGNKDWLINDLIDLKKCNFKSIEITDISAVGHDLWMESFARADVLYFEWGKTYHLMRWMNKSGLSEVLRELLASKVYVWASAGSMVTNPDLDLKLAQVIYEEEMTETETLDWLGFVDFYFLPHLDNAWFKKMREENIEHVAKAISRKIYALDDNCALSIDGDNISVVGGGKYRIYNG